MAGKGKHLHQQSGERLPAPSLPVKAEQSLFLGLDTSAYTTSMALVDGEERLVWEKRLPLPVKEGGLGLRQAEAVFHHLQNLPRLWAEGSLKLREARLAAAAAATRPRPVEGSYMPVFKVSEAFGEFLSYSAGLFFLPSSHQEGHVMAGLWSSGLTSGSCLVLHLSGGTTEILAVAETAPGMLEIALLGGTADLNAGQFVDRIGVEMGLAFPAGPGLEELASRAGAEAGEKVEAIELPVSVKGTSISFSGPASQARRLLQQGCSRSSLARAVEKCIAESLVRAVGAAPGLHPGRALLLVGGVAANSFIRGYLEKSLPALSLYWASPVFAGDNAVGLALQAARRFNSRVEN